MMAEFEGIHPDEGTIHAWLDDALDASEATRVEAHVAECASCAERVAEARGLIAGASRVVGLLDEQPLPLVRPAMTATSSTDSRTWRWLRATPARAAIAAALVVAVGLTLTRERGALDSTSKGADSAMVLMDASTRPPAAPAAAALAPQAEVKEKDSMLASAVAKRVAQDQPARGIGAASGVGVPQATAAPSANVPTMNREPAREVARGRSAEFNAEVASAASADKVASRVQVAQIPGAGCYRLTSPDSGAATWGGVVLPAEIILGSTPATSDSNGVRYVVTGIRGSYVGTWARLPGDQLSLSLRGIGVTTVGALTPDGQNLRGTLSAQRVTMSLSEAVVTGTNSQLRGRADSLSRAAAVSTTPARAPTESRVNSARKDSPETRRLQVVATKIDCPNR